MGVKNIQGELRVNNEKVATASYVDNKIDAVNRDVELLNTALLQSDITRKAKTEDAYDSRVTGGDPQDIGYSILDGSDAVLKKVVGSTVVSESGLVNASFAGIESTGRNLIPFPYKQATSTNNGVTFTSNADGSIIVNGQNNGNGNSAYHLLVSGVPLVMKAGIPYTLSIDTDVMDINVAVKAGDEYYSANKENNRKFLFTEDTRMSAVYVQVNKGNTANLVNKVIRVMFNAGTTALPYEPYIEPSVLNFPQTELGEGDSIDLEKQKTIVGGKEIVLDGTENWVSSDTVTEGKIRFCLEKYIEPSGDKAIVNSLSSVYKSISSEQTYMRNQGLSVHGENLYIYDKDYADKTVDEFKAHIAELKASGTPVVVRYLLKKPIETPFTEYEKSIGNEYRVYSGGTENVLGNDNAKYGARNTLTQSYIVVKNKE